MGQAGQDKWEQGSNPAIQNNSIESISESLHMLTLLSKELHWRDHNSKCFMTLVDTVELGFFISHLLLGACGLESFAQDGFLGNLRLGTIACEL